MHTIGGRNTLIRPLQQKRKFNLPRNVQPEGVSSKLTSDGTLTIEAIPLRPKEGSPARAIPIKIVGGGTPAQASPSTETKSEEAK
ncbi:hypothetical protein COOONC_11025 [Cooperia oncophora]